MASTLTHTFSTPTGNKKFTLSMWVKRCDISSDGSIFSTYTDSNNRADIRFNSANRFSFFEKVSSQQYYVTTNRLFRDPSAFYHIVVQFDTTQSTAADRIKLWVNGAQETSFNDTSYPSQDYVLRLGSALAHTIGDNSNNADQFEGYISHIAYVDGSVVAPTTFGETDSTSGIWKFKSPTGVTWGTNGFHLKFENSGNLGLDSSGQSNNFTTNGNLKQSLDTPSNNHATLNPLDYSPNPATLENGNTTYNKSSTGSGHNASMTGTLGVMTGKWYFEFKETSGSAFNVGMIRTNHDKPNNEGYYATDSGSYAITNSGKIVGGSSSSVSYSHSTNDIFGMAFDLDNGKFYVHVNGTYITSGDPTSGSTGTGSLGDISLGSNIYVPVVSNANYEQTTVIQFNFGNGYFGTTAISSEGTNASAIGKFEYDVPTGYTALSTKGLNE